MRNKKKYRKWYLQYYQLHKEHKQEYQKQYTLEHPEYNKLWHLAHPEQRGQYYLEHREKMIQQTAQWQKENPEKVKAINTRHFNKRERNLDFVPLNEYFKGAVAHHLDGVYVIYIPEEIHKNIYHNQFSGRGMNAMNALAFNYL